MFLTYARFTFYFIIIILFFYSLFFDVGTDSKRFDNLCKRFIKKPQNVQQQSRSGSGVSDVSKYAKDCIEYSFWNG